jgi:hypothetical protein
VNVVGLIPNTTGIAFNSLHTVRLGVVNTIDTTGLHNDTDWNSWGTTINFISFPNPSNPSLRVIIFGGEKMHGIRDDKDYMIKHFIDSAPSFT